MRQIPREKRLGDLLGELGVAGLKAYFVERMVDGETFNHICESLLLPYRQTAEIVGWNYRQRKFGEPYEFREPKLPARPALQLAHAMKRSQANQLRLGNAQCDDNALEL
jgi:hypothetical protein